MMGVYEGGCACGAIRYRVDSAPLAESHCQCRDCRRRSGTGHGSYLTFADRARVSVTGEPATWRVAGDSGHDKIHAFCPACGAPVWLTFAAMPALIAIHAGSLDAPERFRPAFVTYTVRGLGWDTLDPGLARFERMPPG